jgi:hypothetical protein
MGATEEVREAVDDVRALQTPMTSGASMKSAFHPVNVDNNTQSGTSQASFLGLDIVPRPLLSRLSRRR